MGGWVSVWVGKSYDGQFGGSFYICGYTHRENEAGEEGGMGLTESPWRVGLSSGFPPYSRHSDSTLYMGKSGMK